MTSCRRDTSPWSGATPWRFRSTRPSSPRREGAGHRSGSWGPSRAVGARVAGTGLPEPVRFGRYFVQALLEVLCGRRPAGQLAQHTSPRVQAGLSRDQDRGNRFATAGRNPVVRSVRIMQPAAQVAELTAVVQVGHPLPGDRGPPRGT